MKRVHCGPGEVLSPTGGVRGKVTGGGVVSSVHGQDRCGRRTAATAPLRRGARRRLQCCCTNLHGLGGGPRVFSSGVWVHTAHFLFMHRVSAGYGPRFVYLLSDWWGWGWAEFLAHTAVTVVEFFKKDLFVCRVFFFKEITHLLY